MPGDKSSDFPRKDKLGKIPGGVRLPNGVTFRNKSKLVKYLRKNPGLVWKHRGFLKSQAEDALHLAGYNIPSGGKTMQQYEYQAGKGKLVRAWTSDQKEAAGLRARGRVEGTKVIKVPKPTGPRYGTDKVPKKAPETGTSVARRAGKQVGAPVTDTTPANRAGKQVGAKAAPGETLFDMAIKRLLGLNSRAGYQPLDADAILGSLDQDTLTRTNTIQSALDQLKTQGKHNVGRIGGWYDQIGEHMKRAGTRGAEMTAGLSKNLAGNNAAILASIGGEAALGASPAAQTAQQGQNTLAAFGAADAQFLNDMGPLLQAEGANLKASELGRIAQLEREYRNQLAETRSSGGADRAKLALQIAEANNQGRQQGFTNAASVAETLAGLALSGQKITQSQQQAIASLMAKAASDDKRIQASAAGKMFGADQTARNAAVKSTDQKIAQVADYLRKIPRDDLLEQFEDLEPGKLATPDFVERILSLYRNEGADLRDPRVKKAAAAAIQQYGFRVDPRWVAGWQ